jgi:C1A family cysteine protease
MFSPPITRRRIITGAAALAGGSAAQSLFRGEALAAPPPPKVDLRKFDLDATHTGIDYTTPVKNQNTCNACTAFAVVAAIEATYNRKKYPTEGDKESINLSEGQLFFAAGPKDKCATTHWWPESALAYCLQVGLARENNGNFADNGNQLVKIKRAERLLRPKLADTQALMRAWIYNTGPVIAVMAEYSDFYNFSLGETTAYYPGVVSSPDKPWFVGGHVLAIVGYDDNNNKKYWTCKNSYGNNWNVAAKGYVNIAYGGSTPDDAFIDSIDVWGLSFD